MCACHEVYNLVRHYQAILVSVNSIYICLFVVFDANCYSYQIIGQTKMLEEVFSFS